MCSLRVRGGSQQICGASGLTLHLADKFSYATDVVLLPPPLLLLPSTPLGFEPSWTYDGFPPPTLRTFFSGSFSPLSSLSICVRMCRPRTTNARKSNQGSISSHPQSDWNVWPFPNYVCAVLRLLLHVRPMRRAEPRREMLLTCPSVLQLTARSLPAVHSDERLQPLLTHLR